MPGQSLVKLEAAEQMLAEIVSATDALNIIDYAEAARVYAREAKLGTASINHATIVKLRAERRLADIVDEGQAAGRIASPGGDTSIVRPPDIATLDSLGVKRQRLVEARAIRDAFTEDELLAESARKSALDQELSRKRLLRVARERRAQPDEPEAAPSPLASSIDLRRCAIEELSVEPASVDLIFTDPPYPREFLAVWDDLAALAAEALKPGGLLVAYTGQFHLPRVLASLGAKLEYVWLGALVTPGAHNQVHARKVRSAVKPLLFFARPPATGCGWMDDAFVSERREKEDHAWQQSVGCARYYIERLTKPGALVCDPFLGSGTTAVAATELGRRFVGCDVDEAAVATARRRLAA